MAVVSAYLAAGAALVTGYLAYVALGPIADEENAYIFIALRMMAVIGVVYAVAFVLAHRGSLARKSGRSELHG